MWNKIIERDLPLNVLVKKGIKKIYNKFYHVFRRTIIKIKPINIDKKNFRDFRAKCNFIFNTGKKEYYIKRINELHFDEDIIADADQICNHIFNLLGSGEINLGTKIKWNQDFKSKFVWENKYYKDIKIVDLSNGADVKIPWELSRFQHVLTLGKAYWITDDEKYAEEFKNQISSWIEENPIEMSVNWTCTMDVAIRAVNWIIGYFFFNCSQNIEEGFWDEFNEVLYLHGKFIIKNLENKGKLNGNHYLSNLVGLIWLGIYFGDFIVNDKNRDNNPMMWLEFGINEMEKEMLIQVNSDGTNYETSTAYHRLVTELFLITSILCNKNNIYLSKEYSNRLEKMCEFLMNITKPNGLSPLIGDMDDGRLVILSNYCSWNKRDFRHILSIAGEYFDRDDFRYFGNNYKEDALWTTGEFKEDVVEAVTLKSKAYRDGGYYILRNEKIYCFIRCGELSLKGRGGHSHNDQLSFELNINGEDIFIDPGVYVYTADYRMRNLFRSTQMHNTISIEGYEQNKFDKFDLFNMKEETNAECIKFSNSQFTGKHYGYMNKCGVIHERSFEIERDLIKIIDKVEGAKTKSYNISGNLIIAANKEVRCKADEVVIWESNNKVSMYHNNNSIEIDKVSIAPSYGKKNYSKKIRFNMKDNENLIIIKAF